MRKTKLTTWGKSNRIWGKSVFFVLFVFSSHMISAQVNKLEEQKASWQTTGISAEDAKYYFSTKQCNSSELKFVSCLMGVEAMANSLQSPKSIYWEGIVGVDLKLSPKFIDYSQDLIDRNLTQIGGLPFASLKLAVDALIPTIQSGTRYKDAFYAARNLKLSRVEEFKKLYQNGKNAINFEVIVNKLLESVEKEDSSSVPFTVAKAFNSSLLVEDPHARIMTEDSFNQSQSSVLDTFVGVGVSIYKKSDLIILKPIQNGPAEKSGVETGDILVAVDDFALSKNQSFDELLPRISGKEGTKVTLTVLRKNKLEKIDITRNRMNTQVLSYEVVDSVTDGSKIGYLKLSHFMNESSCDLMANYIMEMESQGVSGLVLDLRDNPGGTTTQATCVAGLFLGLGKVAYKQRSVANNSMTNFNTTQDKVTDLNLVVLINSRSASASELLSGALQDYKRAWVVGDRSFGKGTVQMLRTIGGNSLNHIIKAQTIAQFYQPSGRSNQIVGILPDVHALSSPIAIDDENWSPREADLFVNIVPNVSTEYVQNRPEQLKSIESCLDNQEVLKESTWNNHANSHLVDYPLVKAMAVLTCDR